MKKIAKVITNCHDCDNCKKFDLRTDNYTRAFVCYVKEEDDKITPKPFLLDYTESGGRNELLIPENCPLEDYKENEK